MSFASIDLFLEEHIKTQFKRLSKNKDFKRNNLEELKVIFGHRRDIRVAKYILGLEDKDNLSKDIKTILCYLCAMERSEDLKISRKATTYFKRLKNNPFIYRFVEPSAIFREHYQTARFLNQRMNEF